MLKYNSRLLAGHITAFSPLLRPSPAFLFRLASNVFPDVGSVGRIKKKSR